MPDYPIQQETRFTVIGRSFPTQGQAQAFIAYLHIRDEFAEYVDNIENPAEQKKAREALRAWIEYKYGEADAI